MANQKITQLTEVSSFTSDDDLIPIVINTDTVPSNASISKANLQTAVGGGAVDSVNGEVGVVVLDTDDINEGTTNEYYTEAKVSANTDVVANTAKNSYPSADATKLSGIEAGAEVNDNASEIKTKYESNADTNAFTDAEKTNLGNQSGINTGDQDLSGLALKSNVLELDNTSVFTPSADYEPATKKYVDDNAGGSFDPSTDETITGNWEFSNDLAVSSISNPTANVFKVGGNNMLLLEQNSVGGNQSVSFEVGVGSLKSFTFSAAGGQRLERANFSLEQGMVIKNGNTFTFNAPREMLDVGGNVIANGYKIPNGLSTDVLLADGTTTTLPSGGQLLSRQFGTNITFYSGNEWTRPAPGSDFQTINERSFSTGATATVRTTGIDLLNIPANAQLKNMHFTFRKNFLAPNCTQIQIQILARNYDVNGEYNSTSPVVLQTETLTPNNGGTYFSECNFFDVDLSGIASTTVARNITVCFRQTDDADTSYTARTNCLLTYQI